MIEKINRIEDKIDVLQAYIMFVLIRLSAKILRYIMVVFVITGLLRFRPEMLMQLFENHEVDAEKLNITLQETWMIIFPVILAVDLILEAFWTFFRYERMNNLFISLVTALLATAVVYGTEFNGDSMLTVCLFWWVIKSINWWLLKKTDFEIITIHKAGSMGTAVCLQKENEMHGRTKT